MDSCKKWVLASLQAILFTIWPVKHADSIKGWVEMIVGALLFLGLLSLTMASAAIPDKRWLAIAIPSVLFLLTFIAAVRLKKRLNDVEGVQPARNRDALIAAFTEMGEYAEKLISRKRMYIKLRDQYGEDTNLSTLRSAIESEKLLFEQASLAAKKEINIAGGMLELFLTFKHHQIAFKVIQANDTTGTLDAENSKSLSIDEIIRDTIRGIDRGNRPISN